MRNLWGSLIFVLDHGLSTTSFFYFSKPLKPKEILSSSTSVFITFILFYFFCLLSCILLLRRDASTRRPSSYSGVNVLRLISSVIFLFPLNGFVFVIFSTWISVTSDDKHTFSSGNKRKLPENCVFASQSFGWAGVYGLTFPRLQQFFRGYWSESCFRCCGKRTQRYERISIRFSWTDETILRKTRSEGRMVDDVA